MKDFCASASVKFSFSRCCSLFFEIWYFSFVHFYDTPSLLLVLPLVAYKMVIYSVENSITFLNFYWIYYHKKNPLYKIISKIKLSNNLQAWLKEWNKCNPSAKSLINRKCRAFLAKWNSFMILEKIIYSFYKLWGKPVTKKKAIEEICGKCTWFGSFSRLAAPGYLFR